MTVGFEVGPDAPSEAIRRALARCEAPVRVERGDGGARLVVAARDADAARVLWLRAGVEPRGAEPWPAGSIARHGALAAAGRWWCVAAVPLATGHLLPRASLVLAPVDPATAARTLAAALRPRFWRPRRRSVPRPLAHACASILARRDGVVRAFAVVAVDGDSPIDARARFASVTGGRARPLRLRSRVLAAWAAIERGEGGVWRLLSDLEDWWRT